MSAKIEVCNGKKSNCSGINGFIFVKSKKKQRENCDFATWLRNSFHFAECFFRNKCISGLSMMFVSVFSIKMRRGFLFFIITVFYMDTQVTRILSDLRVQFQFLLFSKIWQKETTDLHVITLLLYSQICTANWSCSRDNKIIIMIKTFQWFGMSSYKRWSKISRTERITYYQSWSWYN